MTEQELRALVREAIARHVQGREPAVPSAALLSAPESAAVQQVAAVTQISQTHVSHAQFALPASGGPCVIEPAVPCTHCGFCKSYGH